MRTLRRLSSTPTPAVLASWRYELLTLALLGGGLFGMATGAY